MIYFCLIQRKENKTKLYYKTKVNVSLLTLIMNLGAIRVSLVCFSFTFFFIFAIRIKEQSDGFK